MATLTKSTGTVTLSGAAEKVTLPASYGWVWVKNMSEGDIFAGLSADISEGADGVMVIPAGECGRIQTDGFNSIYLMGSGNALVVAQNYADSPFKLGGKGGEIPDLSEYAKTVDVPNIKVNSAVDADTVGGHSVNADVPADAVFTDTIVNIRDITLQFSNISWVKSPAGKYHTNISVPNVTKIIGACIAEPWGDFVETDIVQPLVGDTSIGLICNTDKKNGTITLRVAYV